MLRLVLTALVLATAGCFVSARGQLTTGPDRLEAAYGIELVAPSYPHAFVANFSTRDVMFGYGRLHQVRGVPVVPYLGGVWRHTANGDTGAKALGIEAGVVAPIHHFQITAGLQATRGDGGTNAVFLGVGYDVLSLCPGCGTTE